MSETATQLDVPDGALCLGCNYSLRGLPGNRCPECGREFDRGDPWTMHIGRPMGRVAKFLLSPVGQPTVVVAWIATGLTVWWTSYLSGAWSAMQAAILLWTAIYAYRMFRFVLRMIVATRYRQQIRKRQHRIFAVLLLATGLLIWTRAPLRILMLFHRSAFEALAHRYYTELPMLKPPQPPRYIGVYQCGEADVNANAVRLRMGAISFCYVVYPYPTWLGRDNTRTIKWGNYYVSDDGFESEFLADFVRFPELNR